MAPYQRAEVGEVVVANVHAVCADLLKRFLHVEGVPMHDGVQREAEGSELFLLPLLQGVSDSAAFSMVDAAAQAMTQLGVIELGRIRPVSTAYLG